MMKTKIKNQCLAKCMSFAFIFAYLMVSQSIELSSVCAQEMTEAQAERGSKSEDKSTETKASRNRQDKLGAGVKADPNEIDHHAKKRGRGIPKPIHRLRSYLVPPRMLLRQKDQLNLSAEQQSALESLMNKGATMMKTRRQARKSHRDALEKAVDQWTGSTLEEAQADETLLSGLRQFNEAERQWREGRLEIALKARRILSAEQREMALKLKNRFKKSGTKRKKSFKGRRKGERRLQRLEERLERLERQESER